MTARGKALRDALADQAKIKFDEEDETGTTLAFVTIDADYGCLEFTLELSLDDEIIDIWD